MIKAADLIGLWWSAIWDKWGYIWGRYGQIWTKANQKAATREQTVRWGEQWVGHHVADCSGLAFWAFQQLGGYVFHGSNTIWNQYVTCRSSLVKGKRADGMPMLPGDPVFLVRNKNGKPNLHHIGYYVGNDTVIEAKGTRDGVVTSPLSRWHETAHWLNVEYENGVVYMNHPTLRKGSSGDAVRELQELLNQNGAALTVDGKFGSATETALRNYQQSHGLVPDGICGAATMSALAAASQADGDLSALRAALAGCLSALDRIIGAQHG
ncbi:MAG: peptidoglycan-binding protein [Clostridiales bacterium]|nr:peptidoglycan-binding protein [Clostridiales bacterium]